ncbi:TlpA family protein disulfide reductase [Salibacterium halotolerans]|uniref:Peroxiredoxin n=1 Tax=Salibacterium halotolerans TaxID=1884432 RepID=A0A1I5NSL4_9BACI|nr:TlpA disulfide reductase family protein [Salibacterium halotolerans]SFP24784.1 Peroxiredoxin [Salibacterium halotolerans]
MLQRKYITMLVLGVSVLAVAYVLFSSISFQKVGADIGNAAPRFELPMYNGEEGSLSDYEGDVIVLNMWASWCGPCTEEIPALMEFQESYRDRGVTVLTVNMNSFERNQKEPRNFVETYNMTRSPAMIDKEGKVADLYNIQRLPTTYIIGRNRTIVDKTVGPVEVDDLEELVESEL